jgi:hypothetical protein
VHYAARQRRMGKTWFSDIVQSVMGILNFARTIFIPIFINNKKIKEKILAFLLQRVIITTNVIIFYARVSFSELTLLCERK